MHLLTIGALLLILPNVVVVERRSAGSGRFYTSSDGQPCTAQRTAWTPRMDPLRPSVEIVQPAAHTIRAARVRVMVASPAGGSQQPAPLRVGQPYRATLKAVIWPTYQGSRLGCPAQTNDDEARVDGAPRLHDVGALAEAAGRDRLVLSLQSPTEKFTLETV